MNEHSKPNDDTPEAYKISKANANVRYPPSRKILYGRNLTDDEMGDAFEKHLNVYKQEIEELNPERNP